MLLAELRKLEGVTQVELAEKLDGQLAVSQLEQQDDMQISTLQRIVKGAGWVSGNHGAAAQGGISVGAVSERGGAGAAVILNRTLRRWRGGLRRWRGKPCLRRLRIDLDRKALATVLRSGLAPDEQEQEGSQ